MNGEAEKQLQTDGGMNPVILIFLTVLIFTCVYVFVAAFWAYILYPPNWGKSAPRFGELIGGYFLYAVYAVFLAGKSGLIAGAVEGIWFSVRVNRIESLNALLAEAAGVATIFTIASASLYKYKAQESLDRCRPGDFGCGAEFWWFAWLVLASTAVLCGYCLSSKVLAVRGPSSLDS